MLTLTNVTKSTEDLTEGDTHFKEPETGVKLKHQNLTREILFL